MYSYHLTHFRVLRSLITINWTISSTSHFVCWRRRCASVCISVNDWRGVHFGQVHSCALCHTRPTAKRYDHYNRCQDWRQNTLRHPQGIRSKQLPAHLAICQHRGRVLVWSSTSTASIKTRSFGPNLSRYYVDAGLPCALSLSTCLLPLLYLNFILKIAAVQPGSLVVDICRRGAKVSVCRPASAMLFLKLTHLQIFTVFNRASLVPGAVACYSRRPRGISILRVFEPTEHFPNCCPTQVLCLICRYFDFEAAQGMDESQHRFSAVLTCYKVLCCHFAIAFTRTDRYRIPVAPEKGMWLNVKLRDWPSSLRALNKSKSV